MINLIRRFQQPLLIALTVVVIVAFVIIYGGPGASLSKLGSDSVGKIYGRNVTPVEYRSIMRQFQVCQSLGMFDLILPLTQSARTMQEAVDNYVWNTLVLRHEARALGVVPTENQIADTIQKLPAFLNQGKFDHNRYQVMLQMQLSPRGMNAQGFEELITDYLRLQAVRDVLAASSTPAPDELLTAYSRQYQKAEASVARILREEIASSITLSDEDIQKAFEERKDSLKTPEKRTVQYVFFPLPTPATPDAPRPDAESIQKLLDKASDFAGSLLAPGAQLEELAKNAQLEVNITPAFAATERIEALGNQRKIVEAAFQLTPEKPASEPLDAPKGYFVLYLKDILPAKALSLEEAKPQLTESLKKDRTRETLAIKAAEARKKIDEALKAGKPFAEAAQAAGLKVEALEAFSRTESKFSGPDASLIQNAALELKEGQLSTPLEGADGTLLLFLSKRLPIDPADVEKKREILSPMLETQRTEGLLAEWMEQRRNQAGLLLSKTP
ncbi:MAG: Chaperone SurA [Verrucomicrobiota bacterium]